MDIDLGAGIDGVETSRKILAQIRVPIVFLTVHQESEFVQKTKEIPHYGYIIKESSDFVLESSIDLALKLFAAQEKVRDQELAIAERYLNILQAQEVALIGFWNFDSISKKVEWSDMMYEIFGLKITEGIPPYSELRTFIHPDDLHNYEKDISEAFREGAAFRHTLRIIGKDNIVKYVVNYGTPVLDDSGNVVRLFGIMHDITEHFLTQKQLHESRDLLSAVLDTVSDAIVAMDADTKIVMFNPAAEKFFQYHSSEIIGKPFKNLFAEDSSCGYEFIEDLILGKSLSDIDKFKWGMYLTFRRRDKSAVIAEVSLKEEQRTKNGLVVATFHDVTEKKKAEKNLKKSNEKFIKLFQKNPESMIIIRVSDSIIIDVNESLLRLSGFSREEVIGKRTLDLDLWVEPEDRNRTISILLQKGELRNYECMFRIKSGAILWGNFSAQIVEIDNQPCFLATITDISDRKRTEEQNLQYLKALELLVDMSEIFIKPFSDSYENVIGIALKKICEFMRADKAHVFLYNVKQNVCAHAHQWCRNGIAPWDDSLAFLPAATLYDWMQIHKKGEAVYVDNVGELQEGALKNLLLEQNLKSFVSFPMCGGDECMGFIGFDFILKHYGYSYIEQHVLMKFSSMLVSLMQRREAETTVQNLLAEKEALIREVHHRIKNNINAIISVLSLQMYNITNQETKSSIHETIGRFRSMAVLYDLLYRSSTATAVPIQEYFRALVDKIRQVFFSDQRILIQIAGDDVIIDAKRMSYVGIIVTELITNAIKYAFDGTQEGEIIVSVYKKDNAVQIVVEDNGKGMSETIASGDGYGFGFQLVTMMARQLKGHIDIERNPGTKISLVFDYCDEHIK